MTSLPTVVTNHVWLMEMLPLFSLKVWLTIPLLLQGTTLVP